jgi:hypothetical protein
MLPAKCAARIDPTDSTYAERFQPHPYMIRGCWR